MAVIANLGLLPEYSGECGRAAPGRGDDHVDVCVFFKDFGEIGLSCGHLHGLFNLKNDEIDFIDQFIT
jgi:hypothetical protein